LKLLSDKIDGMKLTHRQNEFLTSLLPLALHVEDLTRRKAIEYKGMTGAVGFNSILFICEVLIASDWGTHPLAQETYKGKPSNNLLLIRPVALWDGPRSRYEGEDYCMYLSWDEFAVEFSDHIVFSGIYNDLLKEKDFRKQIEMFCLTSDTSSDSIEEVLNLLGIKQECQKMRMPEAAGNS
jgi:hypothetical protein